MIQPRQYQLDAVAAVWRFLEKGYGNPVVVAPTGAGKSVIIALLMREAVTGWPGTRVICLADVKELLDQNANAYARVCSAAVVPESRSPEVLELHASGTTGLRDYGLYGASLDSRDTSAPVTFAQIQSCHSRADVFGRVDFIVVDEAHMINPKAMGMYREFVAGLKTINPLLKIIGFTATPYRLGHGHIFKGGDTLFSGVAYDIRIERLIADGHLVPPVARAGACHADTENIERNNIGEFKDDSAAREFSSITAAAVADMVARLPDRHAILVFACTIDHAQQVVSELRANGERSVELVTGATHKDERARILRAIRDGSCRWLVNVGVLTKGFDAPNIDVIVLLRATESATLYVQMIGRGLRPFPGKKECVVLDYGENVLRHGPIDAVIPKNKGERRDPKQVRAKECATCGVYIALACRVCPHCGEAQPLPQGGGPNHGATPGEAALLSTVAGASSSHVHEVWYDVQAMLVRPHNLGVVGATPSLCCEYQVALASWVKEFICPEHTGYARAKAEKWMNARGYNLLSVSDAAAKNWPKPRRIKVRLGGKWPEVVDYEFGFDMLMGAG